MKKVIALLLTIVMLLCMTACAAKQPAQEASEPNTAQKDIKLGYTVSDMTNPIWAAMCTEFERYGKEKGCDITVVDCQGDSGKQVTQIENFITAGCDAIVIAAADENALDAVIKEAHDAGIFVIAYTQELADADAFLTVDNYTLGYEIGKAAAQWANDHFDGKCEAALLSMEYVKAGVERGQGERDGLLENSDCTIVFEKDAVTAAPAMDATETMLQAHPDVKIVMCIGDGGAIGAAEAVKASGIDTSDFGIFSADATDEALTMMIDGDPIRVTMDLGGGPDHGRQLVDIALTLIDGGEGGEFYMPINYVNIDNAQEYLDN